MRWARISSTLLWILLPAVDSRLSGRLSTAEDVLLVPPDDAIGSDVSFIMLHGAQIAPSSYTGLMTLVQQELKSDYRLWVGIPDLNLVSRVFITRIVLLISGYFGRGGHGFK
jgi:hypothetical protein